MTQTPFNVNYKQTHEDDKYNDEFTKGVMSTLGVAIMMVIVMSTPGLALRTFEILAACLTNSTSIVRQYVFDYFMLWSCKHLRCVRCIDQYMNIYYIYVNIGINCLTEVIFCL